MSGLTFAASCRIGCSTRATAQAWRWGGPRSASRVSTSLPVFWRHSLRIGRKAHTPVLRSRRRRIVRRNRRHNQAQLILELERIPETLVEQNTKRLVEALADLLLEALVGDTKVGGVDEPQDHA